jgi:hypothetical protein
MINIDYNLLLMTGGEINKATRNNGKIEAVPESSGHLS